MTLNDVVNMIHTDEANLMVYVFNDEDYRDVYRKGGSDEGLLFVISSPYVCKYFLKDKFADAEVKAICPASSNVMDVIISEAKGADDHD